MSSHLYPPNSTDVPRNSQRVTGCRGTLKELIVQDGGSSHLPLGSKEALFLKVTVG
ncbi:MAG: hypothetical protein F6J89_20880 [Symploca sp. SIO1C4]|uniref:Uncharacterized protein n=1 Tax=Symploca sp. SIO1C4 TaxID=2607765 RepID=A0A6B3NEH0_9CYAN|nr:hypothetical protein [Symploca sp. SIO1C4]